MKDKTQCSRRSFFGKGLLAGAAMLPGAKVFAAEAPAGDGFAEPARRIPFAGECDVLVAGGGPAGVSAAIAAARAGAKVTLLEARGALGGIWTTGLLTLLIDFGKSDFDRELTGRLKAMDAGHRRGYDPRMENYLYEPEYMKLLLDELCREAGVNVRLNTLVTAAYRDPAGCRLETVVTESKSGREAWRAKTFIDCTGDGDLAARAGCGFDLGYGPAGVGQPASLIALIHVPHPDEAVEDCIGNGDNYFNRSDQEQGIRPKYAFLAKLKELGIRPSYSEPTLFRIRGGLMTLMANHEYGVRVDDAAKISAATADARREIHVLVAALAKSGGGWRGTRIVATADQLGQRDARRIHGRYTLTREDVVSGRKFEDAVTLVRSGIDIHALDRMSNEQAGGSSQTFGNEFKPFEVPLRALIAKDVDNLYMAGRCISGDFIAHAAFRVTGTAVATGYAAGTAAAKCR